MEPFADLLGFLLLAIAVAVALTLIAASVLLLFFDTETVKQRKLKRLAKEDYKQARGTAHRQLLEAAARGLNGQIAVIQRRIDEANRVKQNDQRIRDQELRSTLERWLVETRLQRVPGIGERLKQEISRTVFTGKLADLRRSYVVPGIGEQRQKVINQWVAHYEAQIPERLAEPFPGKDEIVQRYERAAAAQDRKIEQAMVAQQPYRERLRPINRELNWLKQVTAESFIRAYQEPLFAREREIDRYLKGVFAEWEPMPDWFRDEVATRAS